MKTDTEGAPAYTRFHWAKSDRQDSWRIHLLEHHLADVGACFEALLDQPTIRKRLAATGGLDDLDESLVARLSVFAALHDIGKVNVGFQTQIWSVEALQGKHIPRRAGHTLDLVPVLNGDDRATGGWFFDALGWDDLLAWDDREGETVCAMLVATLSHHGRPLELEGERLTGALLDRLAHRVHILEMNGESYRLKQSRQAAALRPAGDSPDA